MNEENSSDERQISFGDYLPSAGIVGVIFGLLSLVVGLVLGYQQINSEPTGSFFSPATFSPVVICLLTMFAGLIAVWHFTKEVTPKLTLGQGAVLGFLTGTIITIISVLLQEIWIMLIDPEYMDKFIQSMIANYEVMDIPESQKDDIIDGIVESMESGQSLLRQLFIGIPISGLLNLLTALIGVKIFAEKKEESF